MMQQLEEKPTSGGLPPLRMSRLFCSLSAEQLNTLAHLAVTHGVFTQVDGPLASNRVVLPLHLEIFQVLLLHLLQQGSDTTDQVWSGHALL
jgi:hypothetical protein